MFHIRRAARDARVFAGRRPHSIYPMTHHEQNPKYNNCSEARTPDIRKSDFPAEFEVPDWRSRTCPGRALGIERTPFVIAFAFDHVPQSTPPPLEFYLGAVVYLKSGPPPCVAPSC